MILSPLMKIWHLWNHVLSMRHWTFLFIIRYKLYVKAFIWYSFSIQSHIISHSGTKIFICYNSTQTRNVVMPQIGTRHIKWVIYIFLTIKIFSVVQSLIVFSLKSFFTYMCLHNFGFFIIFIISLNSAIIFFSVFVCQKNKKLI